ncbi:LysM peptidoglycan-binding domain-containing protein [Sulfobacillus thermosulfidooxidans]|uniref:LysM peptidoglycan-binding domain-containing protein n=1 Tax=Sulfobacillus thermosulfidooxidans TaxID=28034 RepID=UPI00031CF927|nr:LysM peptidoglycan-binding domain-containing protein [Sulfobacillus thermosulfidooxidans]
MAKQQDNIIGGIILIAAAILVYELWKDGTFARLFGGIFGGSAAPTNTASTSGYTGFANNAPSQSSSGTSSAGSSTTSGSSSGYSGTYTVQLGDALSGIAAKYGVSVSALEAANPQITNPNLIYPGETVHVPKKGSSVTSTATVSRSSSSHNKGYGINYNPSTGTYSLSGATRNLFTTKYTVQLGDTLSGIAAKLGVNLSELEAANPQITNPNRIYPGEQLNLPKSGYYMNGTPVSRTEWNPGGRVIGLHYFNNAKTTVEKGQTLGGIAQAHGLILSEIEKLNPQITNPNLIYPGEEVTI